MAKVKISQLPSASSTDYVDTTTFPATSGATNDTKKFTLSGISDYVTEKRVATLTLSAAQVNDLNSNPVAFGLTVPSGYIPVLIANPIFYSVYNSADYDTNTDLAIRSVGGSVNIASATGILAFSADILRNIQFPTPSTGLLYLDGADLEVYVPSGNPANGDSPINIYIQYQLIQL